MSSRPIFFTVKKSGNYLSWRPYGNFFNFTSVCVKVIDDRHFIIAPGTCQEVYKFGRKLYTRARSTVLKNGVYELVSEIDGGYYFALKE